MSEITEIAEKAAEEIYGHVNTDGFGGIDFERNEIVKIIEEAARAAIQAYEAALIEATMKTGTGIMRKHVREGEERKP